MQVTTCARHDHIGYCMKRHDPVAGDHLNPCSDCNTDQCRSMQALRACQLLQAMSNQWMQRPPPARRRVPQPWLLLLPSLPPHHQLQLLPVLQLQCHDQGEGEGQGGPQPWPLLPAKKEPLYRWPPCLLWMIRERPPSAHG